MSTIYIINYFIILLLLFNCINELSAKQYNCGYSSCPKIVSDAINVHLVSHTHDDVGWLKTVDQYYYGSKNIIQRAGVQYILDSVVNELVKNKRRKFIYVETVYFWKWWQEQDDHKKNIVKNLINEGRLEMISGGWCMNDEATTYYTSIIDQMTLGHSRIINELGSCAIPRIAWQIDTFGHSKEQASLFAHMNFDGLFLGRIDWKDKSRRKFKHTLEFIWHGNEKLGVSSDIFTSVLPNTYDPPKGFCFDEICTDDPLIDDPLSSEYNIDKKVYQFLTMALLQSYVYNTNQIIMTMGSDFQYHNALVWYKNLDKLINHTDGKIFNGKKFHVFYSTPSCYLYSLNNLNLTWTTKSDDFLPYSSDMHSYWTGFYTSRPSLKYFERNINGYFQSIKQLQFFANLNDLKSGIQINSLRESLATLQHHDAITGTEKQAVADDYIKKMYEAIQESTNIFTYAYSVLLTKHKPGIVNTQYFCFNLNITECSYVENENNLVVNIYNPYSQARNFTIRLPWNSDIFHIYNPNAESIEGRLLPLPSFITDLPERKTNIYQELVFNAYLSPLGLTTYFIDKTSNGPREKMHIFNGDNINGLIRVDSSIFSVYFDSQTGDLDSIKLNGKVVKINHKFQWYQAAMGNNAESKNRSSGAYIFRPNGTVNDFTNSSFKVIYLKGSNYSEVQLTSNSFIHKIYRISKHMPYIEMLYRIGPIDISDHLGKEVISKFETNIANDGIFYTDSNGRQMMKRVRNHRDTFAYDNSEPISGNYYPINTRIYIQDVTKNLRLTILTDRSQGGSSIIDGSIELMLHRRLLYDDAFGVNEALNETGLDDQGLIITGKHYILIDEIKSSAVHRQIAQQINNQPVISFNSYNNIQQYIQDYYTNWSPLMINIPKNIHILTLEHWNSENLLLRLEHIYEKDEDILLSKSVRINLKNMFCGIKLLGVVETTLSVSQKICEAKRLKWFTRDVNYSSIINDKNESVKDFILTIKPMQIRTLILNYERT